MKKNHIEIITGFLVIAATCYFAIFAYQGSNKTLNLSTYKIYANFSDASGIYRGSEVLISGVKIGEVAELKLDANNFMAVASLSIKSDYSIPIDSTAIIATSGLLGNKYIEILPGSDEKTINRGEKITFTQSSIKLESIISKFVAGIK